MYKRERTKSIKVRETIRSGLNNFSINYKIEENIMKWKDHVVRMVEKDYRKDNVIWANRKERFSLVIETETGDTT